MNSERREYVLGDKLKSEFRERGKDVSGMRASSTSELMKRATMGRDPRENCAEEAFRESYGRRSAQTVNKSYVKSGSAQRRSSPSSSRSGTTGSSYSERAAYASRNSAHTQKAPVVATPYGSRLREETKDTQRKTLSPLFVVFLGVITVMIMFLVTQISDVYKISNEIAQLENKLSTMQTEADELELKLDEKNDIREIERIATDELGMAKEDTMQRRYITISDGERIEIIDNGEENDNTGGIILSSIASAIQKLFD